MGEWSEYITLLNVDGEYPVIEDHDGLKDHVASMSNNLTCSTVEANDYPIYYRLMGIYSNRQEDGEPSRKKDTIAIKNLRDYNRFFGQTSNYTEPFYTIVCSGGFYPKLNTVITDGLKSRKSIELVCAKDGKVETEKFYLKDAIDADLSREAEKFL